MDTASQHQHGHPISQIGWYGESRPCCPIEGAALEGAVKHQAVGRDPHAATRQIVGEIGGERPVWRCHEAQQRLLGQRLPGDQAAPHRATVAKLRVSLEPAIRHSATD